MLIVKLQPETFETTQMSDPSGVPVGCNGAKMVDKLFKCEF